MVKNCQIVPGFIFLILGINSVPHTEIASDLYFILTKNSMVTLRENERSSFTLKESNELKLALTGIIRVYQLFISSQDASVCNFTPSCSNYGITAINKYGIFYGMLMTSDRLQRCHGMGEKYYHIHPESGKSDDPVEKNFLRNE